MKLPTWLQRRWIKVAIECPHGQFIPGRIRLGQRRRYGCPDCPLIVRLTTERGEVTW